MPRGQKNPTKPPCHMYGSLEKDKVLRVWHEFPPNPGGHLQTFGATQVPPC